MRLYKEYLGKEILMKKLIGVLCAVLITCISICPISVYAESREFDTLKSKKVPQSLEIGLFFCQIFIFII